MIDQEAPMTKTCSHIIDTPNLVISVKMNILSQFRNDKRRITQRIEF